MLHTMHINVVIRYATESKGSQTFHTTQPKNTKHSHTQNKEKPKHQPTYGADCIFCCAQILAWAKSPAFGLSL